MPGDQFIVLMGQFVGNERDGFRCVYDWDGTYSDTRNAAIKLGWELRESDDFNIGVIRNRRLVDLAWMNEGDKADASELRDIEQQIGLTPEASHDAS